MSITLIRKKQLQQRGVSLSNLLDESIQHSYPKIFQQLQRHGFIEGTISTRPRNPFTR